MGKIGRVSQKVLNEMIEDSLKEEGFLSDSPAFQGGSYRTAPQQTKPPVHKTDPKIKLFLTEKEIEFIENVLDEVNPDSKEEQNMIFSITQMLRDCLIHR